MLFHSCRWTLVSKTYSPAPNALASVVEVSRLSLEGFYAARERDSRGITSFLYQCDDCKALRTLELLGHEIAADPKPV